MPTDVAGNKLKNYHSPTLVIAAEKDCLFPAGKVLPRAQRIIENCKTHMLEDSGHMHIMPPRERLLLGIARID